MASFSKSIEAVRYIPWEKPVSPNRQRTQSCLLIALFEVLENVIQILPLIAMMYFYPLLMKFPRWHPIVSLWKHSVYKQCSIIKWYPSSGFWFPTVVVVTSGDLWRPLSTVWKVQVMINDILSCMSFLSDPFFKFTVSCCINPICWWECACDLMIVSDCILHISISEK